MAIARRALLVALVCTAGLGATATAQAPVQYLHAEFGGPAGVSIEGDPGFLQPLTGKAKIHWKFSAHIPGATVCPGEIRMEYRVVRAPAWLQVSLDRTEQTLPWSGAVAGVGAGALPARLDGFEVGAIVTAEARAPAFHATELTVQATAFPSPSVPEACTLAASTPVDAPAFVTIGYAPAMEAVVAPTWDEGILPITVTNLANGNSRISMAWVRDGWAALSAIPDFYLESQALSGSKALDRRDALLLCGLMPDDATGDVLLTMRSEQPGEALLVAIVTLEAPPLLSCPVAVEYDDETSPPDPFHELPGAGFWGSLGALGLAVVRRRT